MPLTFTLNPTPQAKIKSDKLYGAYASHREELGGRPYWLLRTKSKALTGKTIKVPHGTTIAKNQYYVEAQWYLSSYDGKGCKKYKLLEDTAFVPVTTIIQEHDLEWEHEGRSGGECTLKEASHARLMQHNYSNVK